MQEKYVKKIERRQAQTTSGTESRSGNQENGRRRIADSADQYADCTALRVFQSHQHPRPRVLFLAHLRRTLEPRRFAGAPYGEASVGGGHDPTSLGTQVSRDRGQCLMRCRRYSNAEPDHGGVSYHPKSVRDQHPSLGHDAERACRSGRPLSERTEGAVRIPSFQRRGIPLHRGPPPPHSFWLALRQADQRRVRALRIRSLPSDVHFGQRPFRSSARCSPLL